MEQTSEIIKIFYVESQTLYTMYKALNEHGISKFS